MFGIGVSFEVVGHALRCSPPARSLLCPSTLDIHLPLTVSARIRGVTNDPTRVVNLVRGAACADGSARRSYV